VLLDIRTPSFPLIVHVLNFQVNLEMMIMLN